MGIKRFVIWFKYIFDIGDERNNEYQRAWAGMGMGRLIDKCVRSYLENAGIPISDTINGETVGQAEDRRYRESHRVERAIYAKKYYKKNKARLLIYNRNRRHKAVDGEATPLSP